jgi:hypothetical protein
MTDIASPQQLVAFFSLEGELANELLEPGVLLFQASLFLGVLLDLKHLGCMGQKLVPPRVVEGLTDLMRGAELGSDHTPLRGDCWEGPEHKGQLHR